MASVRWFVALLIVAIGASSVTATRVAAQEFVCETEYPTETVEIMAPAAPGGGWDTTAREVQRVLGTGVVEQNVEVFNVPGSGGIVGLAQLVSEQSGNEHLLMMMGLVMIGAIETNQAEMTLADVTPIARLTTEYEVIVVPADSPFQTLDDLIAAFQEDPTGTRWAGGSAGGTDHILVGLVAQAVGVDPTQINYIGYSGGGEALAAILGGQVEAGVSGLGEFAGQIQSGELRALAVSGRDEAAAAEGATPEVAGTPSPVNQLLASTPTLQEQGVDVELANWRGLVAPPDISDEARTCQIAIIEQMVATPEWQETLNTYGWSDYFLGGDEYGTFIQEEADRVVGILTDIGLVE